MKSAVKKAMSLLLVLVMCFSMGVPALAAEGEPDIAALLETEGAVINVVRDSASTPTNQVKLMGGPLRAPRTPSGGELHVGYYSFNYNVGEMPSFNGTLEQLPTKMLLENGTNYAAYCLDEHLSATEEYPYNDGRPLKDVIDSTKASIIGDIVANGYQYTGSDTIPLAESYKWAVTQIMIWQVMAGSITRNAQGVYTFSQQALADLEKCATASGHYQDFFNYYYQIKNTIEGLRKIPSFAKSTAAEANSATQKLVENGDGTFQKQFTDSNNVLANFNFSSPSSFISASKDGNNLNVKASREIHEAVVLSASKTIYGGADSVVGWIPADSGQQRFITAKLESETVSAYLGVWSQGTQVITANIHKTSSDGNVSGIEFTVTGTNGFSRIVRTGSDGTVSLNDLAVYEKKTDPSSGEQVDDTTKPITYTVTERVPEGYLPQSPKTFTLVNGDVDVYFNNTKEETGVASVRKTSEDGNVEGITFTVNGSDGSTRTMRTDASGNASLSGLPVYVMEDVLDDSGNPTGEKVNGSPITYTVTENVPQGYVPQQPKTFTLVNGNASVSFENRLMKWRVSVKKVDAEKGTAQGDATLAGAEYGIYKDGTLKDTYTTDANGAFTTKYYTVGTGWTLKEISAPVGYHLNEEAVSVGLTPSEATLEFNETSATTEDQVIKNFIEIFKSKSDDIQTPTGELTPEPDAEFQVYLTSAGSYDAADPDERDYLVTDENGLARTKMLPYGKYTIHQVIGSEGYKLADDIEVLINEEYVEAPYGEEDNRVFRGIINGPIFARVKIVKEDAESGKVIPLSGVGFRVKNLDTDEYVVQTIWYPEYKDLTVYYTDTTGSLYLPYEVLYGNYQIEEVQTAYGYVLDTNPVQFRIDGSEEIVVVTKQNKPQKGVIKVEKQGEVFASVEENNGIYTPIYEVRGLKGAKYEIRAAEDIVTPEGTVHAEEGELVDTVTTDETGKATSVELYLGKYIVTEVEAPYGMVLNTEPNTVEIEYGGQEIEVTEAHTGFVNDRQKVSVSLEKQLEQDEAYEVGMNDEYVNVSFAVYAAEELTAQDGKTIPAGGMVSKANIDEDGNAEFDCDLPFGKYFVKEYSTDVHYVLNGKEFSFEFEYAGQDLDLVHLYVNDGKPIDNELKRGKILGAKVDEDGISLEGALIGIFAPGTTEYTEDTAIYTDVSKGDGSFAFHDVPYGDWIVHEIQSPEGFILTDEIFPVSIREDGDEILIDIRNDFIAGDVVLKKIDAWNHDTVLSGAVFEIFEDTNNDGIYTESVDRLFDQMVENAENPGTYEYHGLRYGGWFVIEKTAPKLYRLDPNAYYIKIEKDGQTEVIKNCEDGFENVPEHGTLELSKTDVANGTPLPNAGFRIKDKDGNIVAEGRSDYDGKVKFEKLRIGEYTYQEFDAPAGYVIDETPYKFEIKEDGQIVKANMTNKSIPVTGDEAGRMNLMIAVIALIALLGVGAVAAVIVVRKRRV